MTSLACKWGRETVETRVSAVDLPMLREHLWHVTTANASGQPYVRTTIAGRTVYMHRMIVQCPPAYKVDHKDTDTLHNTRSNLRVASHDQNNLNRSGWGASGYKGVSRDGRRYRARVTVEGVEKYLGRFDRAVEAAVAYDEAAYALFGEFAWLNFPESYPATVEQAPEELPF